MDIRLYHKVNTKLQLFKVTDNHFVAISSLLMYIFIKHT